MAGYWGYRIVNRWRIAAAEREARSLIENAERDAASIRRAAEVAAGERALAAHEDFEKQKTANAPSWMKRKSVSSAARQACRKSWKTLIRREEECGSRI